MRFNNHINESQTVNNFDDVEHGIPVKIRAWHGTYSVREIRKIGFIVPEHENNPIIVPMGKRIGSDRESLLGKGVYFTDKKKSAEKWGIPLEIEVDLKKPYVIHKGYIDDFRNLDLPDLKSRGYDGIVVQSGRYGIYGGESYRQGVVFDPKKVSLPMEKFVYTSLIRGAKVRNKLTGETGVIRSIQKPDIKIRPKDIDAFYEIKWNKSKKVEYNVPNVNIELVS